MICLRYKIENLNEMSGGVVLDKEEKNIQISSVDVLI